MRKYFMVLKTVETKLVIEPQYDTFGGIKSIVFRFMLSLDQQETKNQ